jgi:hypothetical protein
MELLDDGEWLAKGVEGNFPGPAFAWRDKESDQTQGHFPCTQTQKMIVMLHLFSWADPIDWLVPRLLSIELVWMVFCEMNCKDFGEQTVVAYFKVLSQHSLIKSEEKQ